MFHGAFTLIDTDTDTQTDKKMGCIELCGGVDTALRQTSSQIPIGHCSDCIGLGLGVCVGVGVGVGQCEYTITVSRKPFWKVAN